MGIHTFQRRGVTDDYLSSQVPEGATTYPVRPPSYQEVEPTNEAYLEDLKYAMKGEGWDYYGAGSAPQARAIKQIANASLASDGDSISVNLGWQDIGLEVEITTKGATAILVVSSVLAGIAIGGQTRVLIDGGSFSNAIVGPDAADYPVLSGRATAPFTTVLAIPSTASETTYTIRCQVQAVGLFSIATPRKGSTLVVSEYA